MGRWVHRLSKVDKGSLTAMCENCGPVKIYLNNKGFALCSIAQKIAHKSMYRPSTNPRHTLSDIDYSAREGTCAIDGRVKLYTSGKKNGMRCSVAAKAQAVAGSRRPHGLTPVEARERRAGKLCEVCLTEPGINDHNHDTGALRGFLCIRCNNGFGLLGDGRDIERLERLLEYARKWSQA